MFERFTEDAGRVIVLAQEEARNLKHNYIDAVHVLLGLLGVREGLAARVLESLGITVERVRADFVGIVGSGDEVIGSQIQLTAGAKKVLERALREALSLSDSHIGTEHILLALVRDKEAEGLWAMLGLEAEREAIGRLVLSEVVARTAQDLESAARPVLDRLGISDKLLDGAGPVLRAVIEDLERPADAGDLLVVLAAAGGGVAERTLASLGVTRESLARTAEQVRRASPRSELLPPAHLLVECEQVRSQRREAIGARDFERAFELGKQERRLLQSALKSVQPRIDARVEELRDRLRGKAPTQHPATARTLTPRLNAITLLARREADLLGQEPTAEHVFLAVAWEGRSLGAHVLKSLGLLTEVDERVRQRLHEGGPGPDSLAALELLDLACKEAEALSHDYIGVEHAVLAMTSLERCVIGDVLDELEARERIRSELEHRVVAASNRAADA